MSARTPGGTIAALALLAAALVLGVLSARPPSPLPPDAPAEAFSAARALRVVREVAREPHPAGPPPPAAPGPAGRAARARRGGGGGARAPHRAGTPAQERVRSFLLDEIAALGLEPETQGANLAVSLPPVAAPDLPYLTEEERGRLGPDRIGGRIGVEIANLLARIPGTDSTGAVLLAAHYDSVPGSPGAGDDALGVAALLEALRAVLAGPPLRNDLILLLTDGEELGLLGARIFAERHAWMEDVAVVVNLEARGNAGPTVLFQTGPRDGALVRLFAEAVERPVGTSLAPAVYERMPNDTDFSVFLARGLPGLNLAAIGGERVYHRAEDTPANLSRATLQHQGDVALAVARRLGDEDLAEIRAPDVVFQDLLGRVLLVYPASSAVVAAALALGLLALVLAAALASGRLRARELLWGVVTFPLSALSVVLAALAGRGAGELLARLLHAAGIAPEAAPRGGTLAATLDVLALALLGAAGAVVVAAAIRNPRPPARALVGGVPERADEPLRALASGGAAAWALLAVLALLVVPRGSHLPVWLLALALPQLALLVLAPRGSALATDRAVLAAAFLALPAVLLATPSLWLLAQVPAEPLVALLVTSALVALGTALLVPALAAVARPDPRLPAALCAVPGLALALAASLARAAGA